jgi:hypothetical protein
MAFDDIPTRVQGNQIEALSCFCNIDADGHPVAANHEMDRTLSSFANSFSLE